MLASEVATVDRLSEGRVEFGLGSGWMASDYEQSGMSYDPPKIRVDRFVEAVEIIRRFWSNDLVDFEGEYYTITALNGLPKPHQPGGPPLLIGAGGPRMLRFAGAHADIVGVNPSIHSGRVDAATARDAGADRFDQKVEWVREGAGDRFDDIELNVLIFMVTITDDAASVAAKVAPMFGVETDDFLNMPPVLCGTEDGICARLEARRERWGLSYSVVQAGSFEAMAPIVARMAGQ